MTVPAFAARLTPGWLIVSLLVTGRLATAAVPITALVYSPDGGMLLSNGDRRVDVRSPRDASIQRHLPIELRKITTLAMAPDGKRLAVGGGEPGVEGEVRLLVPANGQIGLAIRDFGDLVTAVAFDPTGHRLAIASADGTARVCSPDDDPDHRSALVLRGHVGPVLAIAFAPGGDTVFTVGADRSLKVWSTQDGTVRRTLGRHTEVIHTLAVRPRPPGDASPVVCATAGDDRTVRIWQPEIGRMVRIVRDHEGSILTLAWAANGRVLYSAGQEGVIRMIDGASDRIEAQWPLDGDWTYAIAVSPDGTTLASGGWSGEVRLHDLRGRRSPDGR